MHLDVNKKVNSLSIVEHFTKIYPLTEKVDKIILARTFVGKERNIS